MTVLITHDPRDTVFSAFGTTLDEAHANAQQLLSELTEKGHHARLDASGSLLKDGLYGWNVIAKKIQYS